MASNMEFTITVDDKGSAVLKDFNGQVRQVENQTKTSSDSMSMSWLSLGAKITAVGFALKQFINESNESSRVNARLQGVVGDAVDTWQEWATALQHATNQTDEAIMSQVAYLKSIGMSDEQTKYLIDTATKLSNVTGMDLAQATESLNISLTGQIRSLKLVNPELVSLTKEQLHSGEAIRIINEQMTKSNKLMMESSAGKWDSMWMSFKDAIENTGNVIVAFGEKFQIFASMQRIFEGIGNAMNKIMGTEDSFKNTTDIMKKMAEIKKEIDSASKSDSPFDRANLRSLNQQYAILNGQLNQMKKTTTDIKTDSGKVLFNGADTAEEIKAFNEAKKKTQLDFNKFIANDEVEKIRANAKADIQSWKDKLDQKLITYKQYSEAVNKITIKSGIQENETRQKQIERINKFQSDSNNKKTQDENKSVEDEYNLWNETENQRAKKSIKTETEIQSARNQVLSDGISLANDIMNSGNKDAFEAGKALSIALATMKGIEAVQTAWTLPAPFNAIEAGLIGATTVANVAKIASTTYQAREMGGMVSAGTTYRVNEKGPELYTNSAGQQFMIPDKNGNITPNKDLQSATKNINVSVNINGAIDPYSFGKMFEDKTIQKQLTKAVMKGAQYA